jgi:hypothetical protein
MEAASHAHNIKISRQGETVEVVGPPTPGVKETCTDSGTDSM